MKFILALVLVSSISLPLFAQKQVVPPVRNYTVRSYDLTLDWRKVFVNKTTKFSGSNRITIVPTEDVSQIVFDASEMRIDSLKVDGQKILPTPQEFEDTLLIPLPNVLSKGHEAIFDIYYTRSANINDGMYFFPKGTTSRNWADKPDTSTEALAYTMSEPLSARKWMPCNDQPYNKADAAIHIIVPAGYSAQSNGSLLSVDTLPEGSHKFNWKSDEPIATYLMVANASVWTTWRDQYHRVSDPNDTVPVIYYSWPNDYSSSDSTGASYNAKYAYRNTPKMLEEYSKRFGEYPFVSYSQVPVHPFNFGGMEHQTITTIDRSVLTGQYEDVIAHELMHQWFGDKTTCETWADIWLNEGFATMGEWVWEETMYGKDAYARIVAQHANGFFNPQPQRGDVNNIPTYDPPIDNVFNVPTTYYKGGCMLYMLRRALNNDTLFFNAIKDYSAAFAYRTANTFEFRDFMAQRIGDQSPVDIATFINEWIFGSDWPIYQITWRQLADNTLLVKIDQTQDSTDHYTMPLRFNAITGSTMPLLFINDKRSQMFSVHLDQPIIMLTFDQNATIISRATVTEDNSLEGVSDGAVAEHYLRANSDGQTVRVNIAPSVGSHATLQLTDVLGRTLQTKQLEQGTSVTFLPRSHLSAGTYFIRLTDNNSEKVTRVEVQP